MSNAPVIYPDLPDQRRTQIGRDLAAALLVMFFCWCGVQLHDAVSSLSALGEGVASAGTAVEDGFASVGDAVGGIPIVGDDLADALDGVGAGTGGNLADLGQTGVEAVEQTAVLAGLAASLLPIAVLLVAVLPRRIRGIREMTAARSMTGLSLDDPEHRRLLAMRAAFGLPFRELLPHTSDPFGDLAAGRYDALVAAALADVGLAPHRPDRPVMGTEHHFEAVVWEYGGKATWYFLSLPPDLADAVAEEVGEHVRGFGSVPVEVNIGGSTWRTSVFPDRARGTYLLPLKKAVRLAEGLEDGAKASVRLTLLDRDRST